MEDTSKTVNIKLKILVVGRYFVGKSSLLQVYNREDEAPLENTRSNTIYLDLVYKNEQIDNKTVELLIYDLAGQEKFSTVLQSIHRNIKGALVIYSIDDKASFEDVNSWINEVRKIVQNPLIYIIGLSHSCFSRSFGRVF